MHKVFDPQQQLLPTLQSIAEEHPSLFEDLEGRLILRALTAGFAN